MLNGLLSSRTAIEIFGWPIQWYGIILTTGILVAFIYLLFNTKYYRFTKEDYSFSIFLWAVIPAIIGARLVYVVANNEMYVGASFIELIAIWNGGVTIIGAIMFGMLGLLVCAKLNKQSVFETYDCVVPCLFIGQIIGRWGNFVNQEAYGQLVTNPTFQKFPFAVLIGEGATATWHYATFFYESCLNFVGLVIVIILAKKRAKIGIISTFYLGWYGVVRAIMETTRTDAVIKDWGALGMVNITQLLCVLVAIVSFILMILLQNEKINFTKKHDISNLLPKE